MTATAPSTFATRPSFRGFGVFLGLLTLLFARLLYDLVAFAFASRSVQGVEVSSLYTHVVLVPFISLYLARLRWKELMGQGARGKGQVAESEGQRTRSEEQGAKGEDSQTTRASKANHRDYQSPIADCRPVNIPISPLPSPLCDLPSPLPIPPSPFRIPRSAFLPLSFGLTALLCWLVWPPLALNDRIVLSTLAYVCFVIAGGFWFLGAGLMRQLAFPFGFLVFLAPIPSFAIQWISVAVQYASAEVSAWFLALTGTTVFRSGLTFDLPGITITVAEECSGIRSSLVLFITSLIAGQMFLRSPWKKLLLALFVIPLGILRNAFRIVTISLLCVHVDPAMIHSWIHRKGGPVFFALSLVPFFLLLVWMRKTEAPELDLSCKVV